MADIIDINVYETVETVTINAQPNLTTINVNSVTSAPQVNSDWNATSGVEEILNKPTIPTQTSQLTNNGADGTNPFITALDIPTAGQAGTLVREVKNMTGATLTKGTVVYISGANGNKPLVSKALATTDALSARTFGLLQSSISNNGLGYCVIIGDLSGLDTSAFTEGAQLYLSGVTAGTYTDAKILAPTHLVYIGKVTRSHPTQGQIEVGIQNGYELEEIHDVAISSVADKQLLSYDVATDLWKNKSVTTADISDSTNKRYVTDANLTTIGNQSGTNTGDETNATIKTKLGAATTSLDGYLTSTDWTIFNGKFNLPSLTSGSVLFSNGTTIAQDNANLFWDNTNKRLGIGTITPTHGLNVYTTIADTGILLDSNTNPAFIIKRAGVERLKLSAAGAVGTVNGLGNGLGFHTDSVERMRLNSAGRFLINTTTDNGGTVQIKAPGALSTDIALKIRNSADTKNLAVFQGDGAVRLGLYEPTSDTTAGFVGAASSHYFYVKSNTNLSGEVGIRRGSGSQEDGIYRFVFDNSNAFINYDRPNQILSLNCQFHTAFNTNGVERGRFNNNGNFLINTITDIASSKLTIDSTTQGFLPPRMTTTQKNAIASPASGLVVYDTTLGKLCVRGASAWETITST